MARRAARLKWAIACAVALSACSLDGRRLRLPDAGVGTGGGDGASPPDAAGAISGPRLVVDRTAIDFGAAVTGFAAMGRLVLQNDGDEPVGVPVLALSEGSDPDFSIAQDQCGRALADGQRCDVRLQLVPSKPGPLHATLQITSDPGGGASVELSGEGLSAGDIVLAPASGGSADFGDLAIGARGEAVFRVTNPVTTESGALTVSLVSDAFSLVPPVDGECAFGTTSLAAGQGCDVRVAFVPIVRGPREATLSVSSPGIGSASLALQGRGRVPGTLGVAPESVDFAGVVLGKAGAAQLRVFNLGDDPLTIASLALDGDGASAFQIAKTQCAEGTVLAGSEASEPCSVDLEFRPTVAGDAAATLHVVSTTAPELAVPMKGNGLLPGALSITPTGSAMPDESGTLDLGDIVVGERLVQAFQINNGGAEPSGPITLGVGAGLTLVPGSAEGDCVSGSTELVDGQSCTVSVELAPTERAAYSGSLTVTSALIGSASLTLRARGISVGTLKLLSDDVNFGRVVLGASAPASLGVRNDGDQPLAPPSVEVGTATSGSAAAFSVENGCTEELAPAAECSIELAFAPTAAGAHSVTLQVGPAGAGGGSVLLLGEGIEPGSLKVEPAMGSRAAFGDVALGETVSQSFTVSNEGGVPSGPLSITTTSNRMVADEGDCNPPGGAGLVDGSSCTFAVRFTPNTSSPVAATLSIDSPGAGAASLALSGRGRNPATLGGGSAFNFGTVIVSEESAPRSWQITNDGDLPSAALRTTGATDEFLISNDGCAGEVLAPGGACSMDVRFSPQSSGPRSASIVVSEGAGGLSVSLAASGVGQNLPAVGQACQGGRCSGSATCEIHSDGQSQVCCAVACTGLRCDAAQDFEACTLPEARPGAACNQNVVCPTGFTCALPSQPGRCCPATCTGACQACDGAGACVVRDDGDRGGCGANEACSGGVCTALDPARLSASVATLGFDPITVGNESSSQSFDVTNVGEQSTIALTVSNLDAFAASGDCAGTVLAPGASCTVAVAFLPGGPGAVTETVRISDGAAVASVTLTGTGVCPSGQQPTDVVGGTVCRAPLLADGASCTDGSQCVSGSCTGSYLDVDGDQFGSGDEAFFCGAAPPSGRALEGGDCCDIVDLAPSADTTSPEFVHPFVTQPDSRPARLCDRPFDFDCDGNETPSPLPALFSECDANCLPTPGPRRDEGADPACGGTYVLAVCSQNPDDLTCLGAFDGGLLQLQTCL